MCIVIIVTNFIDTFIFRWGVFKNDEMAPQFSLRCTCKRRGGREAKNV